MLDYCYYFCSKLCVWRYGKWMINQWKPLHVIKAPYTLAPYTLAQNLVMSAFEKGDLLRKTYQFFSYTWACQGKLSRVCRAWDAKRSNLRSKVNNKHPIRKLRSKMGKKTHQEPSNKFLVNPCLLCLYENFRQFNFPYGPSTWLTSISY